MHKKNIKSCKYINIGRKQSLHKIWGHETLEL